MPFVILGLLLLAGPLSLYDVHKHFTGGISLFYRASYGSIQRALTGLVADGLVSVTDAPGDPRGKKLHTVTPAGRSAWHDWMHGPVTGSDPETVMLARVFFLGLVDAEQRPAVVARLAARIDEDLAGLQEYAAALDGMTVPAEFAEVLPFQRATLDYGIRAHELARDWIAGLE